MFARPRGSGTHADHRYQLHVPPRILIAGLLAALVGSGFAQEPPAATGFAGIAAEHTRQVGHGRDPAELLKGARQQARQQPDSLHTATRLLVALDEPSLRKQHLDDVVAAADRVIRMLQEAELPDDQQVAWMADALYRKGRALGYMELPEVLEFRKIEDPRQHDERFEKTFAALDALVDTTDPEFILLRVRRERRRGNYDEALRLLEIYRERAADPRWYEKKHRDIRSEAAADPQ